jgi:Uma2 family endonuclease
LVLTTEPLLHLSDQAFRDLCKVNPLLNLERMATGELVVMSPSGAWSGHLDFDLARQLGDWIEKTKLGIGFGSSAGFRLPNSAIRSPDAAWISTERWKALSRQEREEFAPLCPDFVAEIASPSDDREALRAKMLEYIEQGARLGWLIDPSVREVKIYRPGREVETLYQPQSLSGEDVLPGWVVDMSKFFEG